MAWAAAAPHGSSPASAVTAGAAICAVLGALRLALQEVPEEEETYFLPTLVRLWQGALAFVRLASWEEIGCALTLWLEVLHPARPWHTAVLGVALACYLLAVHVAESGIPVTALLRRQARVLAAGLLLLALCALAALLPGASSASASAALDILAVAAVVAAAILALPE